jgi:hypothetical protein
MTLPVFIISFNRLDCLRKLVAWLETAEQAEPIIIDNASTYPPLLEWLDSMKGAFPIERFTDNRGPYRVWDQRLFERFTSQGQPFYVVTDPDIVPTADCPRDAIPRLVDVWQATRCPKVGLSLRLDGIPDYLPTCESIRSWEASLQRAEQPIDVAGASRVVRAHRESMLDTTFQVNHRDLLPPSGGSAGIRLAAPYQADHLGWQIDPRNLGDEDRFYWRTASAGASTIQTLKSAGFGTNAG